MNYTQYGENFTSIGFTDCSAKSLEGLHLKMFPVQVVMMLRNEFLKPDGTPRYKQPMWLLWSGPPNTPVFDRENPGNSSRVWGSEPLSVILSRLGTLAIAHRVVGKEKGR
jgi:hypothetical protein